MKLRLVAVLVLSLALALAAGAAGCANGSVFSKVSGHDCGAWDGPSIANGNRWHDGTVAECKAFCSAAKACAGFAYVREADGGSSGDRCWFRSDVSSRTTNGARDCYKKEAECVQPAPTTTAAPVAAKTTAAEEQAKQRSLNPAPAPAKKCQCWGKTKEFDLDCNEEYYDTRQRHHVHCDADPKCCWGYERCGSGPAPAPAAPAKTAQDEGKANNEGGDAAAGRAVGSAGATNSGESTTSTPITTEATTTEAVVVDDMMLRGAASPSHAASLPMAVLLAAAAVVGVGGR